MPKIEKCVNKLILKIFKHLERIIFVLSKNLLSQVILVINYNGKAISIIIIIKNDYNVPSQNSCIDHHRLFYFHLSQPLWTELYQTRLN